MKYKSTIAGYGQAENGRPKKAKDAPDCITSNIWAKMWLREDGVWIYSGSPAKPLNEDEDEPKPEPKRPAAMRKKREIDYVTVIE